MRFAIGLVLFVCAGLPVYAAAQAPAPTVVDVPPSGELALTDGHTLCLQGISQPFADTEEWRNKAQQTLKELTIGRALAVENNTTDRYGCLTAQIYVTDTQGQKVWLQGEMLRRGLAFVYPPVGNEARLDDMRAIESAARRAGMGIWGDFLYSDLPSDKAYRRYGRFGFVSGVVLDASRVKNMVYIHFGENWRESLTLAIAAHDLRAFRAAHIDPLDLKGKTVRARGWIKRDIGPMILLTNPAQIEIVELREAGK